MDCAKANFKLLILALSDDPLDPPGYGRYGGAQLFVFNLGRYLVRVGYEIVYISRKSRPDKPKFQSLGPLCRIYRIVAGPEEEINHHHLFLMMDQIHAGVGEVLKAEKNFDAVQSHNWISGLIATEIGIKPHYHHVLSLGRVRLELGEEKDSSDHLRDEGEFKVFGEATYLICATKDEAVSMQKLYPNIDKSKIRIIPYAVDNNIYERRPYDTNNFIHRAAKRLKERF